LHRKKQAEKTLHGSRRAVCAGRGHFQSRPRFSAGNGSAAPLRFNGSKTTAAVNTAAGGVAAQFAYSGNGNGRKASPQKTG